MNSPDSCMHSHTYNTLEYVLFFRINFIRKKNDKMYKSAKDFWFEIYTGITTTNVRNFSFDDCQQRQPLCDRQICICGLRNKTQTICCIYKDIMLSYVSRYFFSFNICVLFAKVFVEKICSNFMQQGWWSRRGLYAALPLKIFFGF